MEKSIALYLVIMLIGYVKQSDGAEEAVLMQNPWSLDTLSPGREILLIQIKEYIRITSKTN